MTSLHRATAYACLALSMALVGSYVALSKPLVLVFPVFLLAWLRFGIGALAMWRWLRKPADEPPLSPRTRALLFLESFLGNFLFSICMLYGVSLTTAVAAGVVMSSIPAVVAVLSAIFLRERIGARSAAGIACAALGIGLFSLDKGAGPAAGGGQALLGNLLVFAAVVCEASYVVIGKRLTEGLGPKRISAIINLWGLALVTPLGVWAALRFDFGAVALPTWGLLVFYALAASVWTVWLWMTGLKTVPASQAGVFTVMLPISAALIGVVFMGERLSALQLLAFGIAVLGLVLATLPGRATT
ncbi:MAG: DMT family transporter [Comamonadaceae bacterium]|uniref:DMT family transporter n=2 Tax=Hydrogenophaga TaxID=47420 RepID=A0A372ENY6_9BURK|nr:MULTISPECIES: DMT family transporter [Hydrogenophaga]NCT99284.1 DMT family transporter [Comamonadaceae bacterium]RFP82348.1 DMT family transporter [Hydrogenophaga borbori]WQB81918.1 DMT family transporter [Hydrogenophaga sp. SNF1]